MRHSNHRHHSLARLAVLAAVSLSVLIPARAAFAADNAGDEAAKQIISQAQEFFGESKLPAAKEEQKPEITHEEEKPAEPAEAGPSFTLKEIRFEGNTRVTNEELRAFAENYKDRPVTFRELQELAAAVTDRYRSAGYITSRAVVPPQTIAGQTLTIKVVEGKVGASSVEGNRFFKKEIYLEALRFARDGVFRYQDLEKSLYFLNRKTDLAAKAYLAAGKEAGTTDIVLKATETPPFHMGYEYNNRGTKLTHRSRHIIHLDNTNLTGNADTFSAVYMLAEEGAIGGGSFSYALPFDRTGTTLSLDGGYIESMTVKHLKPLEIKGASLSFTPGVRQSLVREPGAEVDWHAAFEIKDSKTLVDDFKTSFDRMRVLVTGPSLSFTDRGGRFLLSGDAHFGLAGFLGSSDKHDLDLSRENSDADFFYLSADIARVQRLPWELFLILRGSGQWTDDNLPTTEQFRVGGANSVRGYPESDSLGDTGLQFAAELQSPVPGLPADWKVPFNDGYTWRNSLRLVGFVDGGKVFLRDSPRSDAETNRALLGAGGGIRFDVGKGLSLQADLGWPLGDDSTDDRHQPQWHITVRSGF